MQGWLSEIFRSARYTLRGVSCFPTPHEHDTRHAPTADVDLVFMSVMLRPYAPDFPHADAHSMRIGFGENAMYLRFGDVLVEQGILTSEDRDAVLEMQRQVNRPFGVLAEEMYGVSRHGVELAWAEQYASMAEHVDPRFEAIIPAVNKLVSRRQAWQFGIIPLHFDGDQLVLATTKENLPRALRFTGWKFNQLCYLVIAEPDDLAEAMLVQYPMAGMSPEVLVTGV